MRAWPAARRAAKRTGPCARGNVRWAVLPMWMRRTPRAWMRAGPGGLPMTGRVRTAASPDVLPRGHAVWHHNLPPPSCLDARWHPRRQKRRRCWPAVTEQWSPTPLEPARWPVTRAFAWRIPRVGRRCAPAVERERGGVWWRATLGNNAVGGVCVRVHQYTASAGRCHVGSATTGHGWLCVTHAMPGLSPRTTRQPRTNVPPHHDPGRRARRGAQPICR